MEQEIFFPELLFGICFFFQGQQNLQLQTFAYMLQELACCEVSLQTAHFLKQHIQQKVMGFFSTLPSLLTQSNHMELFSFPGHHKQEGMKPLTDGFEVAPSLCNWIR